MVDTDERGSWAVPWKRTAEPQSCVVWSRARQGGMDHGGRRGPAISRGAGLHSGLCSGGGTGDEPGSWSPGGPFKGRGRGAAWGLVPLLLPRFRPSLPRSHLRAASPARITAQGRAYLIRHVVHNSHCRPSPPAQPGIIGRVQATESIWSASQRTLGGRGWALRCTGHRRVWLVESDQRLAFPFVGGVGLQSARLAPITLRCLASPRTSGSSSVVYFLLRRRPATPDSTSYDGADTTRECNTMPQVHASRLPSSNTAVLLRCSAGFLPLPAGTKGEVGSQALLWGPGPAATAP
ncbi:hypothetical protein Micbo1qcDRAFT_23132 [Microdochium bolleyi]|uniref:Uncharacterized protein n=1 Tax=Microdochium bolleyi TaxID=196109 RepID=A0A136IQX4_9PEZI|nr:hypothetical protein Micbo1qcDRAFT_23132 [Microdochium bolleyi]